MKFLPLTLISAASILITIVFFINSDKTTQLPVNSSAPSLSLAPFSLGNPIAAAMLKSRIQKKPTPSGPPPVVDAVLTEQVTVKHGDTLSILLKEAGIASKEAYLAMVALSKHYDPRNIKFGQKINLEFETKIGPGIDQNSKKQFLGFSLEPNYKQIITVSKNTNGAFLAFKREKLLKLLLARKEGTINKSLYLSAVKANVPAFIINELIRIFSWDVDFQREIRHGDTFQVMYEQLKDQKNSTVYNKTILFASLSLSGKKLSVYRHQLKNGSWDYFDEAGKSTQKALMRTPIDGARLSSRYGARKHPILGYTMMHRGVDFAAPQGTPIFAAGNGVVLFAGRKGAYGNYVKIRHNKRYSTAYGHMKSFSKNLRRGRRVQQGQTIGFVGTTGRSTGPHLHYEIFLNNKRTNPLRVRMPSGKKLKGSELKRFATTLKIINSKFLARSDNVNMAIKN